jgi:hypothetical protein
MRKQVKERINMYGNKCNMALPLDYELCNYVMLMEKHILDTESIVLLGLLCSKEAIVTCFI